MDHIIIFFILICSMEFVIHSLPINNGFSVKFNPIFAREEIKPKAFGALFARIPQEFTPEAIERRETLGKSHLPTPPPALGSGCTNQIARIVFPLKYYYYNDTQTWENANFINLPIIQQPFQDYKILVATAPPHMKIGTQDSKPMVVYVVFPEDDTVGDTGSLNIPMVYFVRKSDAKINLDKLEKVDPILIVDNNRTVTGLKSKQISKFVKFKNKLIDRYNYETVP